MGALFFLFWSALLIGFSGAIMPGPVLTATLSETLKRGFWAGPLIVLGHALLELAVLAAVVLGLAAWITRPDVLGLLGMLGGALLVLMGAHMALTAGAAVERALRRREGGAPGGGRRGPVLLGVVLSLSNPYWALWWATIGLNLAGQALRLGPVGLASFYAGHISADLAWYSFVALAVAQGRRVCPPAVYRWLIAGCGLAMAVLGVYFAGDGAGRWAAGNGWGGLR